MIDSNYTETLYDVIQQFREYITQNHGSDSQTAQVSDGELRETQTADYFSKQRRSDCAFGEIDAR